MSRLKQLIKNFRYISKKDLRNGRLLDFSAEDLLLNTLYYVPNSSVVRPKVMDKQQTVDLLCKTKKSLARFGDGEIQIISGRGIPFQEYDENLANRMREVLLNNNDDLIVGINHWYFYPKYDPKDNQLNRKFTLVTMPAVRKKLIEYIDFSKTYGDASFTGLRAEHNETNDAFFNDIRTIWDNNQVVLVGCAEAHKKMHYDIFDNASKEIWIHVPNKNAFRKYDEVLEQLKQFPKNSIIILMAGPTSKVLAYDLSKVGYRALDLGHIAKSYDLYMQKITVTNDVEKDFWKPDL